MTKQKVSRNPPRRLRPGFVGPNGVPAVAGPSIRSTLNSDLAAANRDSALPARQRLRRELGNAGTNCHGRP